jgi:hypothetical protein
VSEAAIVYLRVKIEGVKKIPASILKVDGLPASCGLIAAAALAYLKRHRVKCRQLYMKWGKDQGHCIVVFESAGSLHTYDEFGCLRFSGATNWRTDPRSIARAWVRYHVPGKRRVMDAFWFGNGWK